MAGATLVLVVMAAAAGKPYVSAATISYVNLSAAEGDAYVDHFAQRLGADGRIEVATRTQLAQLVGLERQRALSGCNDENATCLTEIMGALGTGHAVTGSLGHLGNSFTASLKLVEVSSGRTLTSASEQYEDESALLEGLGRVAARFASVLVGAEVAVAPSASVSSSSKLGARVWAPAAVAAALAIGAAVSFGISLNQAEQLKTATYADAAELHRAAQMGSGAQTAGWVLAGAAVAGAAVAVVLGLWRPAPHTQASSWFLSQARTQRWAW